MRWEVFKQDTLKKPHQAVGSVHGADAEHALLNARHVFGRRPAAVSMWVVAADDIFALTAEELAEAVDGDTGATPPSRTEPRTFHVFRKASHRRSMTFADHLEDVEAYNHREALDKVLAGEHEEPGLAWWVVAVDDVHRTSPDAAASWFEPAREKTYKQQSMYGTVAPRASGGATK